jgi:hypothetical protein
MFEERRAPRQLLADLYGRYQPEIRDIQSFLEVAEQIFPRLNCGLATVYLAHVWAGSSEIIRGAYNNQPHTYLKIGQTIVDITADQFEHGPAVYFGPPNSVWQ